MSAPIYKLLNPSNADSLQSSNQVSPSLTQPTSETPAGVRKDRSPTRQGSEVTTSANAQREHRVKLAEQARENKLLNDTMCKIVSPHEVECLRCSKAVQLSKKSTFDLEHWNRHRERCLRKSGGAAAKTKTPVSKPKQASRRASTARTRRSDARMPSTTPPFEPKPTSHQPNLGSTLPSFELVQLPLEATPPLEPSSVASPSSHSSFSESELPEHPQQQELVRHPAVHQVPPIHYRAAHPPQPAPAEDPYPELSDPNFTDCVLQQQETLGRAWGFTPALSRDWRFAHLKRRQWVLTSDRDLVDDESDDEVMGGAL